MCDMCIQTRRSGGRVRLAARCSLGGRARALRVNDDTVDEAKVGVMCGEHRRVRARERLEGIHAILSAQLVAPPMRGGRVCAAVRAATGELSELGHARVEPRIEEVPAGARQGGKERARGARVRCASELAGATGHAWLGGEGAHGAWRVGL